VNGTVTIVKTTTSIHRYKAETVSGSQSSSKVQTRYDFFIKLDDGRDNIRWLDGDYFDSDLSGDTKETVRGPEFKPGDRVTCVEKIDCWGLSQGLTDLQLIRN
jgi:hypothetical protein